MERKMLNSTNLKAAGFDPLAKLLEIEFSDGSVRLFKGVPNEVYRRLMAAPNPAAYYEDRIAEEYAFEAARTPGTSDAREKFDSLFGPPKSGS
jgi:KTSC domain